MFKYKIKQMFLNILDLLTYKRCPNCDEITFDNVCDYCESQKR